MLMMQTKNRTVITLVIAAVTLGMATGCAPHYTDYDSFIKTPRPIVGGKPYIIEPPDVIRLISPNAPELHNVSVQLRPDGYVTFYLLGDIFAAGKTPSQLGTEIEEKVMRFYQDATVQVTMTGFRSKVYYMAGETNMGPRPYTGRDTVLDAVLSAGVPRTSWPSKLYILRPDENGGATKRMSINFKDMIAKGDVTQNVVLEEGDILVLPTHPLAALGGAVQNLLMPVDPIIRAGRVPAEVSTLGTAGN
jgi:polysaccharide export outer membrane protein